MKYRYIRDAIRNSVPPLTDKEAKELVDSIMRKVRKCSRQA